MSARQALTHARPWIRDAARDALLRPGTDALGEVAASAFAEPQGHGNAFTSWCHRVGSADTLVPLLEAVRPERGTHIEAAFLRTVAARAATSAAPWARGALARQDLAPTLRPACLAILLRAGDDLDLDLRAELEAAQPLLRGVQTLVEAVTASGTHLPALHACIDHPELGTEVLNTVQRFLFDIPSLSLAELERCTSADAAARDGWVENAPESDFLDALATPYAGALSGQPSAWTAYADALKAQLVHLPDAPGPTGGWRCKAQVVRALADLGPSCAHPVAYTAALALATARLATFPDDDLHFTGEPASLTTLLSIASRAGMGGHPCVLDALVARGPAVAPKLAQALDHDHYWRSAIVLQALIRLAWRHPGCADDATQDAAALFWMDEGDLLIESADYLFRLLSPTAVPTLIRLQDERGELNYTLTQALGHIGGPEARAFLLDHAHKALYDSTGLLSAFSALGDPASIDALAPLEGQDASGEVAWTLAIICALSGEVPPDLDRWIARVDHIEAARAQQLEQMRARLHALATGAPLPKAPRTERRQQGGAKQKRTLPKRKKGKRKNRRKKR